MPTLTPKEQKIFQFIKNYRDEKGYSPTLTEIQSQFAYKAVSSIQQYIEQLTTKGFLQAPLKKNQVRGLELLLPPHASPELVSIPLEGYVAAGVLTEAVANSEMIDLPYHFLKSDGKYFALKIKGESMIEDGIFDGDLVIIRSQKTAMNGQTVVAMVDNEATIKRYLRRETHIELHPANSKFDIINVSLDANFSILGVLASLIRKME